MEYMSVVSRLVLISLRYWKTLKAYLYRYVEARISNIFVHYNLQTMNKIRINTLFHNKILQPIQLTSHITCDVKCAYQFVVMLAILDEDKVMSHDKMLQYLQQHCRIRIPSDHQYYYDVQNKKVL